MADALLSLACERIITPDGIRSGYLHLNGDKIVALDDKPRGRVIDYRHAMLMPGFGTVADPRARIGSADDVAQDVCLAVISALPHYEIKGLSFRAFVYGIAAYAVSVAVQWDGQIGRAHV